MARPASDLLKAFKMYTNFFSLPKPRSFAHRGDSLHYPENTLPAFSSAIQNQIDYLEMDVWSTKDNCIVIHHDQNLKRSCGSKRKVVDLTLAELKKLDPGLGFKKTAKKESFYGLGLSIPTLSEVLSAFPKAFISLEIKQTEPKIHKLVLDCLEKSRALDRVLVAAHSDQVIKKFRNIAPEIPTAFAYQEVKEFMFKFVRGRLNNYFPPAKALQIPPKHKNIPLITKSLIQTVHDLGLEIHVWTINNKDRARELLQQGVDGIMSDDVKMLQKLRSELDLPPGLQKGEIQS